LRVSFVGFVLALGIAVLKSAAITMRDCLAVLGPVKPLRYAPSRTG
jgi:hypothetical protein